MSENSPGLDVAELDCGACQQRTAHQRIPETGAMVCVPCRVRAEMAAKPAAPSFAEMMQGGRGLLLSGAVIAAVGTFLPWITVGMISRSGIDNSHGLSDAVIILCLAAAAAALAFKTPFKGNVRLFAVLASVGIAIVAGLDYQQTKERIDGLAGTEFADAAEVGIGLYACMGGGGLAVLGALIGGD